MNQSLRILHVDDEPDFADVTAQFLERTNDQFDVITETSALDGLDRLGDEEIDCVVSDYQMPEMNGLEFLEHVREDHPDLPFILFTGRGSEEIASDAITAGATDYLQKRGGTEQYDLLTNRVLNAINQYRATRRAADLDRIRTLASDINQALVRADSRGEIETRVCEIISDSHPYLFAWIGDYNPETKKIKPRTSAGIEDGYLDDITITADESPTGQGPGGTALRERRIAISQNVADDPEFEPWRDQALKRGYQSVAAVPLEHEDTLYGELAVYADRPQAFDEDEQELLVELGEDISHALAALTLRDELQSEKQRYQQLTETARVGIVTIDTDSMIQFANPAVTEIFGYTPEKLIGESLMKLMPENYRDRHRKALAQFLETGERQTDWSDVEFPGLHKDGSEIDLNLSFATFEQDENQYFEAIIRDISERNAREQAIEELHRTTDEFMQADTSKKVADIAVGAVRDILELPANAVHLYNEDEEGLVPAVWTDRTEEIVGEPPTFAPGEGLAGIAFETGEAQIYDDISSVPERFNPDTEVRSQIILPLGDHGVLVIGSPEPDSFDETDISLAQTLASHATSALNRVERESDLKRRETLFEAVLETSIDGILVIDENRDYVTWNQQFIDLWGVPEELIRDEPEEKALELALEKLENPQEFIEKVEYLYDHPQMESREEVRLTDGRVFDRYSAPVEADDGTYFGRVWSFRDITEQKNRERELARQNERLEEFANVVSHDLRNPLNVAQGRLELAREQSDSEHLASAANAVDRSLTLIDDVLTLAREGKQISDMEPAELEELCEQCWQNVQTADATLITETVRTICADPSRLKQLVENLMRNAVDHGGESVTVTIGDMDGGFYVADTGPGIPEEDRDEVFTAGYSTATESAGFGLNIVREIAKAHGWDIHVTESEAGGARFEITRVKFNNDH